MSDWNGIPDNPHANWWHWLRQGKGDATPWHWAEDDAAEGYFGWETDDDIYEPERMARTFTYLGPCLTPAEVAAAVQAERAACAAYLTHHAKRLRLRDAQERGIPDAMGHSFEANAADAWAKGILARGDTSALDAAIKAAYREGWNDREADLLASAARIVRKPAP